MKVGQVLILFALTAAGLHHASFSTKTTIGFRFASFWRIYKDCPSLFDEAKVRESPALLRA